MPIIDPDQGVPTPAPADLADNPAAFTNFYTPVKSRLILRYTSRANRTLLHPAPILNETSIIDGETWYERWTGAKWIPATSIQEVKTAAQVVNNSTALVNDTQLTVPLPTASTEYTIEGFIHYNSSTTADFKFALVGPAGATARYGGSGVATTGTTTGDGNFAVASTGGVLSYGGAGVGTQMGISVYGGIQVGATTGSLTLQWAQNALDPTDTTVTIRSWLRATAIR